MGSLFEGTLPRGEESDRKFQRSKGTKGPDEGRGEGRVEGSVTFYVGGLLDVIRCTYERSRRHGNVNDKGSLVGRRKSWTKPKSRRVLCCLWVP